jgi:WD40 repeat protein
VLTLAGDMRGGGINALVASHDLKVFSGSDDGTLRVWNSKSGARMHAFNVSAERVRALAMGSDGTLYLGRAACIELW